MVRGRASATADSLREWKKKSKCNGKNNGNSQYGDLSTTLRSGRDDSVLGGAWENKCNSNSRFLRNDKQKDRGERNSLGGDLRWFGGFGFGGAGFFYASISVFQWVEVFGAAVVGVGEAGEAFEDVFG